jgi:hypothetical protein
MLLVEFSSHYVFVRFRLLLNPRLLDESRKLNKEETAVLEKVVDAITKIKP